jgi:hypothetical protein
MEIKNLLIRGSDGKPIREIELLKMCLDNGSSEDRRSYCRELLADCFIGPVLWDAFFTILRAHKAERDLWVCLAMGCINGISHDDQEEIVRLYKLLESVSDIVPNLSLTGRITFALAGKIIIISGTMPQRLLDFADILGDRPLAKILRMAAPALELELSKPEWERFDHGPVFPQDDD